MWADPRQAAGATDFICWRAGIFLDRHLKGYFPGTTYMCLLELLFHKGTRQEDGGNNTHASRYFLKLESHSLEKLLLSQVTLN